jgi:hypothetical protein
MRHLITLTRLVMAISLVGPAVSEVSEGRLQAVDGATIIVVWRDAPAQDEGLALIRAGVNKIDPSRLLPFIACIVAPGTRAVGTRVDFFLSYRITVLDGTHAGCRGVVRGEVFKTGQ